MRIRISPPIPTVDLPFRKAYSLILLRLVQMIEIGKFNTLTVTKLSNGGCYVGDGSQEVYLPKIDMPKDIQPGDTLEVFIYNDARDSLKATTREPNAVVGDFAALKVITVTDFGAFLDWGIDKDLYVPTGCQDIPLREGDTPIVFLTLDYERTGVIGTCKLEPYFDKDTSILLEKQEVELLVFGFSSIGFRVIINNQYSGMLYKNEVYERLRIGDKRRGFIKKLRSDGRIDAALQQQGFVAASKDAEMILLKALEDSGGFLPLHDKSSPESIKTTLNMSKKIFKKVIGGLYKEGVISIEENGIRLLIE
jgi:predicted RNA-binding protein (virulence factor B family)